jgi:hypothetical protein
MAALPIRAMLLAAAFAAAAMPRVAAIAEDATPDASTPNASTPNSPPSNGPSNHADESMWQYGRREKLCLEWTDGCRGCRRHGSDTFDCSNVGTACLQTEIHCLAHTDEPK